MHKSPDVKKEGSPGILKENVFQAIFNTPVEGILATDSEGKIIMANDQSEKLFGYTEDGLLGIKVEKLIPPRLRKKHKNYRQRYQQDPDPRRMGRGRDLVGIRKDGTEFPIEVSLSPTKIKGNNYIIAFVIDITERKKTEEQIRKEKENAQKYLDIAGSIFIIIDKTQKVTLINQKGCDLLGLPEEDILGKNWFDNFVPQEDRDRIKAVFNRIISGEEQIRSFENQIIGKEGRKIIIYWQNTLIRDDEDNIIATLSSGVDITEKKQAELALRKSEEKLIIYATELERKVQERTEELAKTVKQLENSNKKLEAEIRERKKAEVEVKKALENEREVNELKSRFVSMASHEFRTPLSTILSSASLIEKYQEKDTQEKRTKHVERIKNNVNELTGILNDFLSLDKLEAGKIQYNPVSVELVSFINSVVEELRLVVKKDQIILFQPSQNEINVVIDKQILKNIVLNLVSNAIKYSPDGAIIKILAEEKKDEIIITVKDKGIGIPENEQHHLFERFFRAKNATNIQGTGLGLNLVKKYIDLLEGSINFESKEGEGSTFFVSIPKK